MTELTEENRNRPWEWENPRSLDWRIPIGHQHIDCCVLRTKFLTWCGYARLPDGHPWNNLTSEAEVGVNIHGGCTFFGKLPERSGTWIGFDTAHYNDFIPGLNDFLLLTTR